MPELGVQRQAWTSPALRVPNGTPRADTAIEVSGLDRVPLPRSKFGDGQTLLVHNRNAVPPAEPGSLSVMSYNILLGGKRREEMLAYFGRLERDGRLPDAIGIQEAHQAISIELAARYGYHLAYFGHGDPGPPERTLVNGKAILSRYPIRQAIHFTYALSEADREASIERQRGNRFTDDEDRGVLRATIDLGDRLVDLHNTHLSYGDPLINEDQFRQLRTLIASSKRESVLVGDFNADIGDPAVVSQGRSLEDVAGDVWESGVPRVIRGPDDRFITPEAARAKLSSGARTQTFSEWKLLKDAADGATFEGRPGADGTLQPSGERLDALYATPGLVPERVELDWSTTASDHVPLIARLRSDTSARQRTRRKLV